MGSRTDVSTAHAHWHIRVTFAGEYRETLVVWPQTRCRAIVSVLAVCLSPWISISPLTRFRRALALLHLCTAYTYFTRLRGCIDFSLSQANMQFYSNSTQARNQLYSFGTQSMHGQSDCRCPIQRWLRTLSFLFTNLKAERPYIQYSPNASWNELIYSGDNDSSAVERTKGHTCARPRHAGHSKWWKERAIFCENRENL